MMNDKTTMEALKAYAPGINFNQLKDDLDKVESLLQTNPEIVMRYMKPYFPEMFANYETIKTAMTIQSNTGNYSPKKAQKKVQIAAQPANPTGKVSVAKTSSGTNQQAPKPTPNKPKRRSLAN